MAEAPNNRHSDDKRYVDVSAEPDKILLPLPQSSKSESIPTLLDAITCCEHLVEDVRNKAQEALSICKKTRDDLSSDQSAALYLYSMQWPEGKHSFYFLFNRALRNEDRTKLIPYHSYFKLFMSALNKLPSKEQHVWRGVVGDLTDQYLAGTTHVWWGASSCTDQIHVTGTFFDKKQKRTLFHIKCYEGKTIKNHSAFANESEIVLQPGTYLKVISTLLVSEDVYIVELEQVPPDPKLVMENASIASSVLETNETKLYLIWSDPTVNKSSGNNETQKKLQDIFDNNFQSFESGDQCEKFINQNKNYHLVLIVSGQIGRDLVPKIHNLSQLISIYVYCMNKQANEAWTKNYNKVKAIIVRANELIDEIEKEKENNDKIIEKQLSEISSNNSLNQSRFSDICSMPFLPEHPFKGYENQPLVTLQEALRPVSDKIHNLDQWTQYAMENCNHPNEHGLTKDESAAIMIYTMEFDVSEYCLYRLLNQDLRSNDRRKTKKKWFLYFKLFMTALNKLPSQRRTVWRTIPGDAYKEYSKGAEPIWWGVTTTTLESAVLDQFSDINQTRTIFSIDCENGKCIGNYSSYPNEEEVILKPGSCFKVTNVIQAAAHSYIIQLKEIASSFS